MTTETEFISRRAIGKEEVRDTIQKLRLLDQTRKDWVIPSRDLRMLEHDGLPKFDLGLDGGQAHPSLAYGIRPIAHQQIGVIAGIHGSYYERMRNEDPGLLAINVNRWLPENGKNHLVRTIDGQVRAMLSDQYLMLDNVDVFFNAFQVMKEVDAQITAVAISESRFHVEMTKPGFEREIVYQGAGTHRMANAVKDLVVPYVSLSNSEVGRGGLSLDVGVLRFFCDNGILTTRPVSRIHRGKTMNAGFISEDTRRLDAELVYSMVKDAVRFAFDEKAFTAMVDRMSAATGSVIDEPVEAVATIVEHYGLSDTEQDALLNEFSSPSTEINPGPTLFGLQQALTFLVHSSEDVDHRYELQRAGGDLLENTALIRQIKTHALV